MRIGSLAILSVLVAFPAQAGDFNRYLENVITGYIRPATTEFRTSSSTLPDAVAAVCEQHSPDTVDAFDSAFGSVVQSFGRISFLRFGPLADEDRLSRLAFVPDPRGISQRQIRKLLAARDETVLEAASLADKSVAVQGLTALQLIAFDKSTGVTLGEAGETRDYICGYALAISKNVAAIGAELDAAWSNDAGFKQILLTGGVGNPRFTSSQEALEEVFSALVTGLIVVKDQDILPVLGASPEKARATRMPFSRSGNGIAYIKAELAGIQDAVNAFGFDASSFDRQERITRSLDFDFSQAEATLNRLTPPIRKTFSDTDAYQQLKVAVFIVSSLRDTLNGRIGSGLGLSGGFNALDGD